MPLHKPAVPKHSLKQWILSSLILIGAIAVSIGLFFFEKNIELTENTIFKAQAQAEQLSIVSQIPIRFRGFLTSQEIFDIVAPIDSQVISSAYYKGSTYNKGDILIQLDSSLAQKSLLQAKSLLAKSKLQLQQFNSAQKNSYQNSVTKSTERGKQLQSQISLAQLQLTQAQQQLKQCTITAPFNGIFEQLIIKPQQYTKQGQLLAKLANTQKLQIRSRINPSVFALIPKGSNGPPVFTAQLSNNTIQAIQPIISKKLTLGLLHYSQQLNTAQQRDIIFSIEQPTNIALGTLLDFDINVSTPKNMSIVKVAHGLLKPKQTIWLSDGDSLLVRPYQSIYQTETHHYLHIYLNDNDKPLEQLVIIQSYLNTATDGMPLQLIKASH